MIDNVQELVVEPAHIDDHLPHVRPPENCEPLTHRVLQATTLTIVYDLMGRGLPDVEHGLVGDGAA